MIYASQHYSTALLEKLARGNGQLPPNQHYVEIVIPNGVSYEMIEPAHLPGWDDIFPATSRTYGETWQRERRSALLLVPSVLARMELNILINPEHPAFSSIAHGLHRPVWWDPRLFH